jgi:L-ascorbate PTS family porter component IIB
MLNILLCCVNGSGTSLMMKINLDKVVQSLNVDVGKVYHCTLSEGKNIAKEYDIVFCPLYFVDMFKDAESSGVHIIGLKNLMSKKEMEERLIETGKI